MTAGHLGVVAVMAMDEKRERTLAEQELAREKVSEILDRDSDRYFFRGFT